MTTEQKERTKMENDIIKFLLGESNILRVISRILLILTSISIGWFLGRSIAFGTIALLQKLGLDDNLFRFLDAVSLF